ncbi:hypothetical protein ACWD4J_22005, partial [Streptomyces sp. NPDC002577]
DDYGNKGDHGKKEDDYGKGGYGKEKDHYRPKGGIHAGGGALALTRAGDDDYYDKKDDNGKGDNKKDDYGNDDYGNKGDHGKKEDDYGKGGYGKEKDHRPKGGVHAGGGGLAQSGSSIAAGSALLLAGIGAGTYILRRRNASGVA